MDREEILKINKKYWDTYADMWFGTTALPEYGVHFVTENELHLFNDVLGKKVLEVCCGSGHSLKYLADRNAAELWGMDISDAQLKNAEEYLEKCGYEAKLICSSMERESGDIPKEYFDIVYSIYGIGWTTDLDRTFKNIASYLKKDGAFIFSWHHPLNYCISWSCENREHIVKDDILTLDRSYFDEHWFKMPVHNGTVMLCNRKISTYINALAKAGFAIDQMIEQSDVESVVEREKITDKAKKAKMVPLSVLFKAHKL